MKKSKFQFVDYLWDEKLAKSLDEVGRLVYRSNLLGGDWRVTNTGGGNTSAKVTERDPLTGEKVEVLWVKGSGGDLRTATRENFSSLYQDKLIGLQKIYLADKKHGPKTAVEDAMVGLLAHCAFNLNPRAPSIDTPLHSYVPFAHVDHTHPNAVIAVAASKNGAKLTKEIWGDDVVWTPWQRPGLDLGLKLQELCKKHPKARGVLLGQHGLINWADDARACYDTTLELIERAAQFIAKREKGAKTFGGLKYPALHSVQRRAVFVQILPWLRGQISGVAALLRSADSADSALRRSAATTPHRFIATIQDDETILRFVNSVDAARLAELGTSCPDHFLRTKIKPLFVDWNPQKENIETLQRKLADGLTKYRADYAAYYAKHKRADSPPMRDPNPTVILIPGLGMIAWGKDKTESRVTAEFYNCAVEVMRGAEAIDEYVALPQREAFDIEYWQLEEAKLRRMPPEKELSRQIIAVIGAGSGIGRETAHRIAREGAHVVCVDLNADAAKATAKEITDKLSVARASLPVTGKDTGAESCAAISNCGPAIGVGANITDRASVHTALDDAVLAYGGLDGVVVTAGVFFAPDATGHIPEEKWAATFAINVTGAYLVADEAAKIWREQGLKANLVLTTSVNAVVPKKGSLAYDTSKAAANHLVRELAIELAPLVRVNGIAPATVIGGSSMFPRDRVISSLTKYNVAFSESETTESLVAKLAKFYSDRTLTKEMVTAADQAEAAFLLLTNRLGKTTGQILTVDGGLTDAFLR